MLSRTADHLYWMARYTERAENTARLLDVNLQTSLLPQPAAATDRGWRAMLSISELQKDYDDRYGKLSARDVLHFMVQDRANLSSIASCLGAARENARAVRGALTTEVWETLNTTWLEMQVELKDRQWERDPGRFFEWVKHRSHLSRGVTLGTMLKDEAFHFVRLGTHLERADNTARIIDVKFHRTHASAQGNSGSSAPGQAQSQNEAPGATQHVAQTSEQNMLGESAGQEQQFDFYYWAAILRSVSAFEIYRKVYRDVITPERVAELLMLRADMPRSLLACVEEVVSNLSCVRNDISADTERLAGRLHAQLCFSNIDEILDSGLHAYLTRFLEQVYELGNRVSRDFLLPLAA